MRQVERNTEVLERAEGKLQEVSAQLVRVERTILGTAVAGCAPVLCATERGEREGTSAIAVRQGRSWC